MGRVSDGYKAGDRPLELWVCTRVILPLIFFVLSSVQAASIQAGEGLRTNCATTAPRVRSDMREMIPSEMTQ